MASCINTVPGKFIVDSIHGDIHLTEQEWKILATPAFQRLRYIKQLQMGHLTYPNATHTRFSHSLGTLATIARIIKTALDDGYDLDNETQEDLRMSALLHDVGHYPYSHLMEKIDKVNLTENIIQKEQTFDASNKGYPSHEELGIKIVTEQSDLKNLIGSEKRARNVGDLFSRNKAADPQLSKLIHSSLDMDRLDYLLRDSRAAGVPYGSIDVNYMLNCLKISPQGMLGFKEKALPAAEQFLLARFYMHRAVYFHKTTFGFEETCRQLLRRIRDKNLFGMPKDCDAIFEICCANKLSTFTDSFVDNIILQAAAYDDQGKEAEIIRLLGKMLLERKPPKLLKEVNIFEVNNKPHNGSLFWLNAKNELPGLSKQFEIPLQCFFLCQTKPLRLEARSSSLTTKEAMKLESERDDELIYIFVDKEEEPKPLVDIEYSLIHHCSSHYFQSFRLYVITEELDKIESLKEAVNNWHKPPQ